MCVQLVKEKGEVSVSLLLSQSASGDPGIYSFLLHFTFCVLKIATFCLITAVQFVIIRHCEKFVRRKQKRKD